MMWLFMFQNIDIVKLLSRPGSPVILVFFDPSAGTQFQGEPLSGGVKYRYLTE